MPRFSSTHKTLHLTPWVSDSANASIMGSITNMKAYSRHVADTDNSMALPENDAIDAKSQLHPDDLVFDNVGRY